MGFKIAGYSGGLAKYGLKEKRMKAILIISELLKFPHHRQKFSLWRSLEESQKEIINNRPSTTGVTIQVTFSKSND